MSQHEWLEALARIAIGRYVHPRRERWGGMRVSTAVDRLVQRMKTHLPREALHDSNKLRIQHLYQPEMEEVLTLHSHTLRALYDTYATPSPRPPPSVHPTRATPPKHPISPERSAPPPPPPPSSASLLVGGWMVMLDELGLLSSGQLSEEEACLLFLWSRIRGYGEHSERE
ncbi:MAG: hypothetical protein SGPRY_008886, partial [Prymnesium sp.]